MNDSLHGNEDNLPDPEADSKRTRVTSPRPIGSTSDPALLWALFWDTAAVLALAVIGRASHSESLSIGDVVNTAMPFLAGTYITHLLVVRYFHPMALKTAGLAVWMGTWTMGMLGRLMMSQSNAPAFMGVSSAFLLTTIVGWRGARAIYQHLRKKN